MGFQIKIVGDFCNIRCAYCRNRDFDRVGKTVMALETLEKLLSFLNTSPQKVVHVNWHGGEPLLAGMDFFRHIVRLEKQYSDKIWVNAVQTNATLINEEWAEFFTQNSFRIGVSIDGSEEIHNIDRIDGARKGTYKRAMRGVSILRQYGISPGVICTVTKKTVSYPEEIFRGLVYAGFNSIAFNAFYNTASENEGDEYGLNNQEWSGFVKKVFESWLEFDDEAIRVREIDSILAWTVGKKMNECSFKGTCSQWFVVDFTGDIYPCERFGRKIHFGHIETLKSVQDLQNDEVFFKWKNSIEVVPTKCKSCAFLNLCHNGCSSHRQADSEGVNLYTYCESRLEIYRYMKDRMQGVLT